MSGNVSLYNETNGQGILPTPTIGGVGLIADWSKMARIGFAGEGEAILLVGAPADWGTHLGQSIYLRDIHGRADGPPPAVDLAQRSGRRFRARADRDGHATAVHDLSDGGLRSALAEMAMASGMGATVNQLDDIDPDPAVLRRGPGPLPRTVDLVPMSMISLVLRGTMPRRSACSRRRSASSAAPNLKLGEARAISCSRELKARCTKSWFPALHGATLSGRLGSTMAMEAHDIEKLIKDGIPMPR